MSDTLPSAEEWAARCGLTRKDREWVGPCPSCGGTDRFHVTDRGIAHRRGGYRDPESQAFIESWFGQFKKRLAWRAEWETLDHARQDITSYVNSYQHRPHPGIGYQTPTELATTWKREPLHTRAT